MISKEQFTKASLLLSPALRRIALSILRSEHDAQDAVQQALLKAWEKRETVDPARLKGYLTKILVNVCRDIQRMRMRAFPVDELPEAPYLPPDRSLRDAVDALPELLRTPLLLHYMEGYSEREIAQALSLTLPQLKSRLFRARRKLKSLLLEEVNDR